jgi:antitoxin VapB
MSMPTAISRTFRSGNSEALRLPREVAYGRDVELTIVKSGDLMTIYPTRPTIAEMIDRLNELPGPGQVEVRDVEEIPEPPGL